ncbi:F420-dependent oxidoreductase-like protein [Allocatelliglobosispora scoriae]|uniref:F420-dependent oxidoreductase-like protein n=1 Tax=Allocatelliglobosispora scoriae TaxID=643052 RepID=A0A841C5V4_9ACTN|nr:LLM class F420-dependent oxidoreductase [Allocatelliglobosispora scoriae]MBB5874513.1 F420-dependent oxidoreductase-like protein [Allocatelliglobosispora scoriae]
MRIGLQIPDFTRPQGPATLGPALAEVASVAEEQGFEWLAVMDHFFQISMVGPPENEMLEAYTTLGFLAARTERIKLLTVVTGGHYRTAGLLAKTITTLDVLSQGRAWLGIGAGWNEEESLGLGFGFPPVSARFEILEETLRICHQMWQGDETPFQGKHFQLDRPINSPQALSRPHPPIMIGGGGEKKTLRLVAKYGDACNLFATPDVGRKLDILKEHCEREGRDYDEIYKTVYYSFDPAKGADAIVEDLRRLAGLGFQGALGSVQGVWDLEPLRLIGRDVIPALADA